MFKRISTLKVIDVLAGQPKLWDLFEEIFGANKAKGNIYRGVITSRGKMLDFGCATGNTTAAFLDFDYYGIDINKNYIDRAKVKWAKYKNIRFFCANLLEKPFPDAFFDFVLFSGTGHHLNDKDVNLQMLEIYRILKMKGNLYFFDMIKSNRSQSLMPKLIITVDRGKYVRNESEWLDLFKSFSGFSIIEKQLFSPSKTLFSQPDHLYLKLVKQP